MIGVAAYIMVREGKNEEFIKAANDCIAETRKEEGCISYELFADTENTQRYGFFEKWSTKGHLDAHMKTEHFLEFAKQLHGIATEHPDIQIHKISDIEE